MEDDRKRALHGFGYHMLEEQGGADTAWGRQEFSSSQEGHYSQGARAGEQAIFVGHCVQVRPAREEREDPTEHSQSNRELGCFGRRREATFQPTFCATHEVITLQGPRDACQLLMVADRSQVYIHGGRLDVGRHAQHPGR